jgi:N-acetylneuraminate synthase
MRIANRPIGAGQPVFIVAEIGVNHQGNAETAHDLIDAAAGAGVDSVKFQVGDPGIYVAPARRNVPRETPWGVLPYIEYRRRLEFDDDTLRALRDHAHAAGLIWFASALDVPSAGRLDALAVPCHKVASPMLTDHALLRAMRDSGVPVLLSTGMSTMEEIAAAVFKLRPDKFALLHCTSAYPCPPELANLRMIETLRRRFCVPVGYSGHEVGLPESIAAVALGACIIERHLTLSRAAWGSDHAASLEPVGMEKLVRYVRTIETAMGDGVKHVYAAEGENRAKFRRCA